MGSKVKIYELIDPVHDFIFYVGQTGNPLDVRLRAHIKEGWQEDRYRHLKPMWTRELLERHEAMPIIRELESVPFAIYWDWDSQHNATAPDVREAFWILKRITDGCPIMNERYPAPWLWGISPDTAKAEARRNVLGELASVKDMATAILALRRWGKGDDQRLWRGQYDDERLLDNLSDEYIRQALSEWR